jgi:hypothetical protein
MLPAATGAICNSAATSSRQTFHNYSIHATPCSSLLPRRRHSTSSSK